MKKTKLHRWWLTHLKTVQIAKQLAQKSSSLDNHPTRPDDLPHWPSILIIKKKMWIEEFLKKNWKLEKRKEIENKQQEQLSTKKFIAVKNSSHTI